MRLEQILSERWRGLSQELAKFGTIGVINLFVNFAVFNLLLATFLSTSEVKAKAAATIVATTCAYFMNRHWTYRDRPKSTLRREYSLFFFFNLVGMLIEVTVVGLAKYGFGQTHLLVLNLCGAFGILLGTAFRFWAYRTHVFRPEAGQFDDRKLQEQQDRNIQDEYDRRLREAYDRKLQEELVQLELDEIVSDAGPARTTPARTT